MDITSIPFNRITGLRRAANPKLALLELETTADHLNHVGSIHAGVQFVLAEACAGEFLIRAFAGHETEYAPVVRRAETKFRKPAHGRLSARASVAPEEFEKFKTDLETRKRAQLTISVELFDQQNVVTTSAVFEWFVQRL